MLTEQKQELGVYDIIQCFLQLFDMISHVYVPVCPWTRGDVKTPRQLLCTVFLRQALI